MFLNCYVLYPIISEFSSPSYTEVIKVNGTIVSSGSAFGDIVLSEGNNVVSIMITAQDSITTKTYTITVNRLLDATATLSSLDISQGVITPLFSPAINTYAVSLPNNVTSLEFCLYNRDSAIQYTKCC